MESTGKDLPMSTANALCAVWGLLHFDFLGLTENPPIAYSSVEITS